MHWYARLAVSQLGLHLKHILRKACILIRVKLSKTHSMSMYMLTSRCHGAVISVVTSKREGSPGDQGLFMCGVCKFSLFPFLWVL